MGWFHDEASAAAARQFGRRFYRWYIAAHILRAIAPGLALLTLLTAAGYGAVRVADRIGWPNILRMTALAVFAVLLLWLISDTITGAGTLRRATGRRTPIPVLAALTIAALLTAPLFLR